MVGLLAYFLGNMCAKHYENPTMLPRVTAKNVGDVFFETHCTSVSVGRKVVSLSTFVMEMIN